MSRRTVKSNNSLLKHARPVQARLQFVCESRLEGNEACIRHPPVNDAQLMYMAEGSQDGQGHLQGHSLLCHGPALLQQLLQQVASSAVLHDNVDLLAVLKSCHKACDEGHPACRRLFSCTRPGCWHVPRSMCVCCWIHPPQAHCSQPFQTRVVKRKL